MNPDDDRSKPTHSPLYYYSSTVKITDGVYY